MSKQHYVHTEHAILRTFFYRFTVVSRVSCQNPGNSQRNSAPYLHVSHFSLAPVSFLPRPLIPVSVAPISVFPHPSKPRRAAIHLPQVHPQCSHRSTMVRAGGASKGEEREVGLVKCETQSRASCGSRCASRVGSVDSCFRRNDRVESAFIRGFLCSVSSLPSVAEDRLRVVRVFRD